MKKQTAVQLILSKWNGKMTQDQFANWLNKNQNLLLAIERQQIIYGFTMGQKDIVDSVAKITGVSFPNTNKAFNEIMNGDDAEDGEQYFTETYGE